MEQDQTSIHYCIACNVNCSAPIMQFKAIMRRWFPFLRRDPKIPKPVVFQKNCRSSTQSCCSWDTTWWFGQETHLDFSPWCHDPMTEHQRLMSLERTVLWFQKGILVAKGLQAVQTLQPSEVQISSMISMVNMPNAKSPSICHLQQVLRRYPPSHRWSDKSSCIRIDFAVEKGMVWYHQWLGYGFPHLSRTYINTWYITWIWDNPDFQSINLSFHLCVHPNKWIRQSIHPSIHPYWICSAYNYVIN